jgi:hypothetical protein
MFLATLAGLGAWVGVLIVWTLLISFVRSAGGQVGALTGLPPYSFIVRMLGWFIAAYFAAAAFHAVLA